MAKRQKCDCERGGSFPLFGNGFSRRHFLQVAGTGIGLSIVRKGAERMGGRVGLESKPGKGTRFWIELGQVN